jgi:hypothetical protein
VEAFPAAQLQCWNLPFIGYNGSTADAVAKRKIIMRGLKNRKLCLSTDAGARMLDCADALDAVICVYAAKSIAECSLVSEPLAPCDVEGWIAVHR